MPPAECWEFLPGRISTLCAFTPESRSFPPLRPIGTLSAKLLAWSRKHPGPHSGSKTMTYNFANLQQLAVSILGALVASTLFVSAAVGPVGQFI